MQCGADSITVQMRPEVFGLAEPEGVAWASEAKPEVNTAGQLIFSAPLGANTMSISTTADEETIVAEVLFRSYLKKESFPSFKA